MVAERLIKMCSCISNQIPWPKQHIRLDSCQEYRLFWMFHALIIAFPLGRGGGEEDWGVCVAINKWILRNYRGEAAKICQAKQSTLKLRLILSLLKVRAVYYLYTVHLPNGSVESLLEQLFELLSTSAPFVDYFGKNVKIVPLTNTFISLPMFSRNGKRIALNNIKLNAWDVWTCLGILIAFLLRGFFTAVNRLTRRFSSRAWFNADISVNIG